MNAISLITKDHRSVEQQYARFQQAAKDRRHGIAEKIIHDLSVHAAMEEMRLYPALRQHLGRVGDAYADRSLKEHAAVTEKLARLEAELDKAHTKAFADRVDALMAKVMGHVEEEEQEILPRLEEMMSRDQMAELGRQLEEARRLAPTHPHPGVPKEGVPGVAANVVGKAVDTVRDRVGR